MGWKFWQRDQRTDAERSLDDLQQRSSAPSPGPVASAPSASSASSASSEDDRLVAEADAHMQLVSQQLEDLVGAPEEERGTYMLEVTGIEERPDGTLALAGGAHEGTVAPGTVVGLLVLPQGLALVDESLPDEAAARAMVEGLLRARAEVATVVAWDPTVPELVVSGLARDAVTVGAMVSR